MPRKFASVPVMLSGITVNAGIYLVSALLREMQLMKNKGRAPSNPGVKAYIRAFNNKIIPVALTIISSIAGLVPFLFDGPSEVFWFDFAIGTIAGLLFSVIALLALLPLLALKPQRTRSAVRGRPFSSKSSWID